MINRKPVKTQPKIPFILWLLLLCGACTQSPFNLISESETRALEAVSKSCGSAVNLKKTLLSNSEDGSTREYVIRIDSISEAFSIYKTNPTMLATNAALSFYQNLDVTEKDRISELRIELPSGLSGADNYTYRLSFLDTLVSRMEVVKRVLSNLQNKDYNQVLAMVYKLETPSKIQEGLTYLKTYEPDFGSITGFRPLGFQFFQEKGEPVYARYYATLLTEKNNLQLSIDLPLDPVEQHILGLRYNHNL